MWANFEFIRRTFYLRHTKTVLDRLSGQTIQRRQVDQLHETPSVLDYVTCRASKYAKRLYNGKKSLMRKLDLVRYIHRQKYIEIALKGLMTEKERAEC